MSNAGMIATAIAFNAAAVGIEVWFMHKRYLRMQKQLNTLVNYAHELSGTLEKTRSRLVQLETDFERHSHK